MVEDKKEKVKVKPTAVVQQLPTVSVREGMSEDGTEYSLVTTEEALSEILETIRELKRGLL